MGPPAPIHDAIERLAQAIRAQQTLQTQRDLAPLGLEIDAQIAAQAAAIDALQTELTASLAEARLAEAREVTPDSDRDLFAEQTARYLAGSVDPAAQSAWEQAVADSVDLALATEAGTLEEAQWQRIAQTWQAMDAQWTLETAIADEQGAIMTPSGFEDPALSEAYDTAVAQWQDVSDAFAAEYVRVAASHDDPAAADAAVQAYREDLANQSFAAAYQSRILQAAERAPSPAVALTDAIDERVDADLADIEQILADEGPAAAAEAIAAAKDALVADPVSVPGGSAADPLSVAMAQQALDDALRPTYEAIAAAAPADLADLADAAASTTAEERERALAVSSRLRLYAWILPADLVPDLVTRSQTSWAPAVSFLGLYSEFADRSNQINAPLDTQNWLSTDDFNEITGQFVDIAEALAQAPRGDRALDLLGSEFAAAMTHSSYSVGAFDEALGLYGAGEGQGLTLAVVTINRLAQTPEHHEHARLLFAGLEQGFQAWAERAQDDFEALAENRAELNQYIADWPGMTSNVESCEVLDPNDPSTLELDDAIKRYLETNPEVVATDEHLLSQINEDGVFLLRQELALQGLSSEALAIDGAESVTQPIQDYLSPGDAGEHEGPSIAEIYASVPGVSTEVTRMAAQLAAWQQAGIATGEVPPDQTLAELLSEAQGLISIPRNARFMALEWTHQVSGIVQLTPSGPLRPTIKMTGVGFFGLAATTSLLDANGLGNSDLNSVDRFFSALKAGNYFWIGMRDTAELGYMLTESGSLKTLLEVTGPDSKAYGGPHPNLARFFQLTSRGIFVAADTYTLWKDIADGRNGGIITADALILGGSVAMTTEAAIFAFGGRAAAGTLTAAALGGPAAWIGTGLWTAGAIVKYQFDRVEQSNRFETADHRLFLSHFGSRDDDGNLRPLTDETEVSNFVSHDPDVRTVADGAPEDLDIVYRGLSADAVDELLNYSGDPDSPTSGIPALDRMAADQGIDHRELYLDWFSGTLTHDQRKELTEAAHTIDPAAEATITDDSLVTAWEKYWDQANAGMTPQFGDQGIAPEDWNALLAYLSENDVAYVHVEEGLSPSTRYSAEGLRVLLGLEDGNRDFSTPSPEVIEVARQLVAGTAVTGTQDDYGSGFRPQTTEELRFWLEIHGYPPLPGAEASCDPGPALQPGPVPVTEPPTDHHYTVQAGDTLWDLAGLSEAPQTVDDLISFHNAHRPEDQPAFDPGLIDADLYTPFIDDGTRRDPDLLHPGEILYVTDATELARLRELAQAERSWAWPRAV